MASGANTGVHVLRGFDAVSDLAIDGDTAAFAYGYMGAMRGFSLARVGEGLSKQVPTGHPDIHRRFSHAATDGSLAYFGEQHPPAPHLPSSLSCVAYHLTVLCWRASLPCMVCWGKVAPAVTIVMGELAGNIRACAHKRKRAHA